MTKGIPTFYAGIEFRSRLESRWAKFFDSIGWKWTYEPFDGNGYIPDFLIHGKEPLLVEVKPAVSVNDYGAAIPKIVEGLKGRWAYQVLIVGADPLPAWEIATIDVPAGLLSTVFEFATATHYHAGFSDGGFDYGLWVNCDVCDRPAVQTEFLQIRHPCRHDHRLERSFIRDKWSEACNETKWRPKS